MRNIVLQVNRATAQQVQVNIMAQVNSASIRRETYNGREHIVIPSRTLPFGVVMNGGLYTRESIEANYQSLEGTLAPLGHPMVNGQFVSAFSPEGINVGHVGAWNRNVRIDGNRVYVEKWLDVEVAQRTEEGRDLVSRIEGLERGEGEPISTSVAAFLERMEANETQRQQGIKWVANIHRLDHDAILIDEAPAASTKQGVGLMVNADHAKLIQANAGALVGESYRDRERRIEQAAKAQFAQGADDYVWVADFTDSQAIIVRNGGEAQLCGYTDESGAIQFDTTSTPVVRQESWIAPIVNRFKSIFNNHQAQPDLLHKEAEMALTPEEQAALVEKLGAAVSANMAEQIKPLAEKIEALETNHNHLAEQLTANVRAEEAEKRKAVAAKFGEDVAKGLAGNALDSLYKQCGETTSIGGENLNANSDEGAPEPAEYFGGK